MHEQHFTAPDNSLPSGTSCVPWVPFASSVLALAGTSGAPLEFLGAPQRMQDLSQHKGAQKRVARDFEVKAGISQNVTR